MIKIYTDGSCIGNPGNGGWAAIIIKDGKKTQIKGNKKNTTNNQMELLAPIKALKKIPKGSKYILNLRKSSNLLKGYESIRKLKDIEKRNFNTMCKGSALRYLLTRAYDYLNTPKSALIKIKDPKEYVQKLNFHRKINSFNQYLR